MANITIKIADEFSTKPGVREQIEGDFPGEEFLEKLLLPRFKEAIQSSVKLEVDLDDVAGYATSFLEASFGGLVREFKAKKIVVENLIIIANDDPFLEEDIRDYIDKALD